MIYICGQRSGAYWVRFPVNKCTRHDSRQSTVVVLTDDGMVSGNLVGIGSVLWASG